MNETDRMARRYHWLGRETLDFICEPHAAICCDKKSEVLNLVAAESKNCQQVITQLSCQNPKSTIRDFLIIKNHEEKQHSLPKHYSMPKRHEIYSADMSRDRLEKILLSTYERKPQNFEKLLSLEGVGPKTIRSLAMISELIYGAAGSIKDPVRFSFAHGGKDGIPYPVDKKTYDGSIEILHKAVREAKIDRTEKIKAIKRLANFYN
jgi:hypothetical protein